MLFRMQHIAFLLTCILMGHCVCFGVETIPFKLYTPWTPGQTWRAGNNLGDGYFYGMGISGTTHKKYKSGLDDTYAIDFNRGGGDDDRGLPILSAHEGIIKQIKVKAGYGWVIDLQSLDGKYFTRYTHLMEDPRLLPGINEGVIISNGVQIGKCGDTTADIEGGTAYRSSNFSSHLHFVLYSGSQNSSIRPTPMSGYELGDSDGGRQMLSDNVPEYSAVLIREDKNFPTLISAIGAGFDEIPGKVQISVSHSIENEPLFIKLGMQPPYNSNTKYQFYAKIYSWSNKKIIFSIERDIEDKSIMPYEHFNSPIEIFILNSQGQKKCSITYPFPDVSPRDLGKNWASDFIHNLWKRGVINGKEGKFEKSEYISRKEFLTILLRVLLRGTSLVQIPTIRPFEDVPIEGNGSWFSAYAKFARDNNLIPELMQNIEINDSGQTKIFIKPDSDITRLEASVLLVRVFAIPYREATPRPTWTDYTPNTSPIDRAIITTHAYGIMVGNKATGKISLNNPITREEAAAVIFQTCRALGY